MKKRLIIISILIFIMGVTLACANPVQLVETVSEQPEEESPTTPTILFKDEFSDVNSGWDHFSDEFVTTDYANDRYHILINDQNFYSWANPRKVFSDVRIEVEAELVSGPMDAEYGLICRYRDAKNFYLGLISADGYYGIIKNQAGNFSLIGMDYLQQHPIINQGTTSNIIRFDCIGDTLTLYANDEILAEVKDSEFQNGDVGLIASTNQSPGADVYFDHFTIFRP